MGYPHLNARNHDDATNHHYRSSWPADRPAAIRATTQLDKPAKLPPDGQGASSSGSLPSGPARSPCSVATRSSLAPSANPPGPHTPSPAVTPHADTPGTAIASDTDKIDAALDTAIDAALGTAIDAALGTALDTALDADPNPLHANGARQRLPADNTFDCRPFTNSFVVTQHAA